MSAFTRLGSSLWDWEPFTSLEAGPQVLWLALYTSAEAKRIVPGLWHGSITTMAEASRKPVDETRSNLDRLLDAEMVEFDIKLRVLRLTKLPDAGESPANPNVIRGWFRRFGTVPACPVRDSHVPLLRWMMDEYARESGKPISHGHEQAWQETFGRIVVPAPRRRGVRRLAESDTSTATQPSLFSRAVETVPRLLPAPPDEWADGSSVDNSDTLRKLNKISDSETVPQTVSKRYGSGSGIGSGSGSPDPEGGAGGVGGVDDLGKLVGEVLGGRWYVAQSTPERYQLEDQVARLGGLDLALLGRWMRGTAFGNVDARDLFTVPGRLIWAVSEAERWHAAEQEQAERAREMSENLRAELKKLGLESLAQ